MSFEVTFLGTSGGPQETGNCCLIVKSPAVSYNDILTSPSPPLFMVDAGSGLCSLAELISDPLSLANRQKAWYRDALEPSAYLSVTATRPFSKLQGCPFALSRRILQNMPATFLTHPHLDHISSLVLNSPGLLPAQHPLQVYGMPFTTAALHKHIFNGVVWPDFPKLGLLNLETVAHQDSVKLDAYTITAFELSHGHTTGTRAETSPYLSSAFLVHDNATQAKLLVCGDFEADAVSGSDRNLRIWTHIAPFVADGSLRCLILECSSCGSTPDDELYGHMSPLHLMRELQTLGGLCPIKGLNVIVTHIKETFDGSDPRRKILAELRELNESLGLGLSISVATNGLSVVV